MNQNNLFSFFFFFFFLSLLTRIALCSSLNPKFEACQPRTCGNQNISYPFYIKGRQEPYCGYPGFGLSCSNNGFPILNLSGNQYIIHEISYTSQSIRVSEAAISSLSGATCVIPRTDNVTLDGSRFNFAPNQTDLFLVFGCDLESLPDRFLQYRIGCSAEKKTMSVLAMTGEGEDLRLALEKCNGGMVKTKVEDDKKGRINGEVVRRGFVLNWIVSDCSSCEMSGGKCGFDVDLIYSFRCHCPDKDHARECNPVPEDKSRDLKLGLELGRGRGLGLAIGFAVIVITIGLFIVFLKRRYNSSCFQNQSRTIYFNTYSDTDPEYLTVNSGARVFSYEELEKATNKFDPSRELGSGGFGTVYYGKLQDRREVAVKRLYERKRDNKHVKQFKNEIQVLTQLRHRNLVSLYGCTSDHGPGLLLVYEYVPNGTLGSHIHGALAKPGSLPWPMRMKIAMETASALTYLHSDGIIHRDVKTNNILLDNNFCVKVADFGISRLSPNDVSHVCTTPQGTMGYIDPDYLESHKLTNKSDVYSFGVVLIELISSMPAVDQTRNDDEIKLANLAIKKIQRREFTELIDASLCFKSDNEYKRIVSVAELAFQCLQRDKELRPSMYEVLEVLQKIESGKDEPEPGPLEAHGARISLGDILTPPSTSHNSNEVALLKN